MALSMEDQSEAYMGLLLALGPVGEEMRTCALAGDWDSLLGACRRRQELVDQIDALGAPVLQGSQLDAARRLLQQQLSLHEEVGAMLVAARGSVVAGLELLAQGRQAVCGYGKQVANSPLPGTARLMDEQR